MSDILFRWRAPLSAVNTIALSILLLWAYRCTPPLLHSEAARSTPFELTLADMSAVPDLVQIQPVQPPLRDYPVPRQEPLPALVPKINATDRGEVASTAIPTIIQQPPSDIATLATTATAMPIVQQQVAATPVPTSTSSGEGSEALYIGKLRAYLQSIKRYPTGREVSQQHPTGTATVWFILQRNGSLLEAGIERSSTSLLLDNAALATVRRGSYPPFPDQVWGGREKQRFTVDLAYILAN